MTADQWKHQLQRSTFQGTLTETQLIEYAEFLSFVSCMAMAAIHHSRRPQHPLNQDKELTIW
jgi:hypothetical protein